MKRVATIASLTLPLLLAATMAQAQPPRGWIAAGSDPGGYDFGTASTAGKTAAYVKAKPNAQANGFGTMMQCISADNYIGKRLRFQARLKSVEAQAVQLWMRVDARKEAVAFYNMSEDPVRGTSDWREVQAVLDVPSGSTAVCYGFFLAGGGGEAWADSLSLETVGKDVPVSQTPKAPVNLGFER